MFEIGIALIQSAQQGLMPVWVREVLILLGIAGGLIGGYLLWLKGNLTNPAQAQQVADKQQEIVTIMKNYSEEQFSRQNASHQDVLKAIAEAHERERQTFAEERRDLRERATKLAERLDNLTLDFREFRTRAEQNYRELSEKYAQALIREGDLKAQLAGVEKEVNLLRKYNLETRS